MPKEILFRLKKSGDAFIERSKLYRIIVSQLDFEITFWRVTSLTDQICANFGSE